MIDAETLAGWKRWAESDIAARDNAGANGRILALIAEVERLQTVATSVVLNAGFQIGDAIAERDALQAQVDAVKALHWAKPPWRGTLAECQECDRRSPCETTRILAALGETGDDRG